jgi:hypothetical protein
MRVYQNLTNSVYPHINAKQLLISILNNSLRILIYPQATVVKIHYAIYEEACLVSKQHWRNDGLNTHCCNNHWLTLNLENQKMVKGELKNKAFPDL